MKPEHRRYILANIGAKSVEEIARDLGLRERNIRKFLKNEDVKKDGDAKKKEAPARPGPEAQPAFRVNKAVVLSILLVIVLGFAAYASSLNGQFLYDDNVLIGNNVYVRNWAYLPNVFREAIGGGAGVEFNFYRPIQILTYMIDYTIWKYNVVGYHLTNIGMHILAALAVYWLINILFRDNAVSLVTAALFVVHPVHTTIVDSISARADSLCVFFMLVAFIFYIKSVRTGDIRFYAAMAFCYILSLASKENGITFVALLPLYHYAFRERVRPREILTVAGIALAYIALRLTVLRFEMTGVRVDTTVFDRLPAFFVAIFNYVRILFLPFDLHIEYGKLLCRYTEPHALLGLVLLIFLGALIFKTAKKNTLVFFSVSWFLVTLLPVSNIYPINAYMAESWLYLPSIGFFLLMAGGLCAVFRRERLRTAAIAVTVCLLIFYSYLTARQSEYWRDPVMFYLKTLKYNPESTRLYNNLGNVYYLKNDKEKAIAMYRKAIEKDPANSNTYNNLGVVYAGSGRNEEAIAMYRKAVDLDPRYADAYNNLGMVYSRMGREAEARAAYEKAAELNPHHPAARSNIDLMNASPEKEIELLKERIKGDPADSNAYNQLGIAYFNTGNKEESIASFRKAVELNPAYADPHNNLGNVYSQMGRNDEAIKEYSRAIEIDPGSANAYNNIANEYYNTGNKDKAADFYMKAIEKDPRHAIACANLASIYYNEKRYDLAIQYYDMAIDLGYGVDPAIMKDLEPFRRKR